MYRFTRQRRREGGHITEQSEARLPHWEQPQHNSCFTGIDSISQSKTYTRHWGKHRRTDSVSLTTKSLVNTFVNSGLEKELEILGNELKSHRNRLMEGKVSTGMDELGSWRWTDKANPKIIP